MRFLTILLSLPVRGSFRKRRVYGTALSILNTRNWAGWGRVLEPPGTHLCVPLSGQQLTGG